MIVGSLLLILVAVVLLVVGLTSGSSALLIGSIGASLLAAVALVVGARHAAADRAADGADRADSPRQRRSAGRDEPPRRRGRSTANSATAPTAGDPSAREGAWAGAADRSSVALVDPVETAAETEGGADERYPGPAGPARPEQYDPGAPTTVIEPVVELDIDEDPPDEPAPQPVTADAMAQVARLSTPVVVVDGRPRYHLSGCVHLLGRTSEPLPVSEAVELGFTPCGLCEPDTRLLDDARRA